MMHKVLIYLLLACLAAPAFGLDCSRSSKPVEQAICRQPELMHLDDQLNDLYGRLLPTLAARARGVVRAQQEAWIGQRDHVCAGGDAGCLRRVYEARLETLSALYAASQASDAPLSDLHPLVIRGTWKATAIRDPGGKDVAGGNDVPTSLANEELPAVGALIGATPGSVCKQGYECGEMAWTQVPLAKVDGGEAMGRVLGLQQAKEVLLGNPGAKMIPPLVLVPRGDGVVWAVFGLCGTKNDHCHYAAEEWTPAGPSYTVGHLP